MFDFRFSVKNLTWVSIATQAVRWLNYFSISSAPEDKKNTMIHAVLKQENNEKRKSETWWQNRIELSQEKKDILRLIRSDEEITNYKSPIAWVIWEHNCCKSWDFDAQIWWNSLLFISSKSRSFTICARVRRGECSRRSLLFRYGSCKPLRRFWLFVSLV